MSKETFHYILLVVITLVVAIVLSMILRKILSVFITKYAKKLRTDPTNFSFIKNSVGFVIYSAAIIFIFFKIPYLKSLGTALFAVLVYLPLLLVLLRKKLSRILSVAYLF